MKKFLLTTLLFLIPTIGHCTTWYACTSGGNWSANVWTSVSADQGTCAAALGTPVAGDTATLNASSGNITITSAAASAFMDETGYAGTLAFGTQTLTLTTGANLGGAMTSTSGTITNSGGTVTLLSTVTGSFPKLNITGSQTFISNGFSWPGVLSGGAGSTVTINNGGATWNNTGQCTSNSGTMTFNQTISGDTLTCANGIFANSGSISGGTATILLTGGNWTGNSCTTNINGPLILAGNVTVSGIVCLGNTGNITYSSGTIITTGSTLTINNGTETLNTPGVTWNNITFLSGSTLNLGSNLFLSGTLKNSSVTETLSGAFNITTSIYNSSGTTNFVAGQTLNITSAISTVSTASVTKSATASSPTYINYSGTLQNQNICGNTFTDVQASGNTLYDYGVTSSSLTRTLNILPKDASKFYPHTVNHYTGV